MEGFLEDFLVKFLKVSQDCIEISEEGWSGPETFLPPKNLFPVTTHNLYVPNYLYVLFIAFVAPRGPHIRFNPGLPESLIRTCSLITSAILQRLIRGVF